MKAPSHIAGGFAFTGLFCSLFNINIFDDYRKIALLIFFSLLPDIDHTKSIIGKLFYPLAKWLSVRFGHRTITHSILFVVVVTSIFKFAIVTFNLDSSYYLISVFALSSHLILDMITVQGVPLFYPFAKNPCVMPANQQFRFRTNDLRGEAIVFFVCTLAVFSMQDLFAKGFWTTYNESFNSLQHVQREYRRSSDYLILKCDYLEFGQKYNYDGLLLTVRGNDFYLLEQDKVHILNDKKQGFVIKNIELFHSEIKVSTELENYESVSLDSLTRALRGKFFLDCSIFSNEPITVVEDLQEYNKTNTSHFLHNGYNLNLISSVKRTGNTKQEFDQVKYKIRAEQIRINRETAQRTNLIKIRDSLKNKVAQIQDSYELNELKNKLIELDKKIKNFKKIDSSQIRLLQSQIRNIDTTQNEIKVSATVETLKIPKKWGKH